MAEGLIMNQYIVFYYHPCINATNDLDEQISIREHLT